MRGARSFPGGTSDYLNAGNIASAQITGTAITVSAFIRCDNIAGSQKIVAKWGVGVNNNEWLLGTDGVSVWSGAVQSGGSQYTIPAGPAVVVGKWTHVLLRQDASRINIIADLVRGADGTPRSLTDYNNSLMFGRAHDGGGFVGAMAHVAIWAASLDWTDIARLYHGADPRRIQPGALRGYYPLTDYGPSGQAYDLSPLANHASMTGSVPLRAGADGITIGPRIEMPFGAEDTSEGVPEVTPPFGTIGAKPYAPTIDGPEVLDTVPFGTIGAKPYVPNVAGAINPPLGTIGAKPKIVTLVEGELPPYVPPSLPPTIPPGSPTGPGTPLPPLSAGGLAGIRFYQGPPWRWVVTDLDTTTITFLDRLAAEAVVTYGLKRPAEAKLSVPSDSPEVNIVHTDLDPFVAEGNRNLYGFRREGGADPWVCRYGGRILQIEDTGLTEDARTVLTAWDPRQLLYHRPMVNVAGEFPNDAGFFSFDDTQLGTIALTFLRNTILLHGEVGIDMGDSTPAWSVDLDGNPVQLPGTPYYSGTIETTTQLDINFQQGLSVGEVWDQLEESGAIDLVLTPIYDPVNRPGYFAELSVYARAGVQRDDAVFAWDKPSRNVVKFNRLLDGNLRANVVKYYEGQGGPNTTEFADGPSILKYGESWHSQFWPGREQVGVEALAQLQLELRANGVETVNVEPTMERAPFLFTEWGLGDTVPVYASAKLREAVAGFQRVYGFVIQVDENAYERVPQVLASPEAA